MSRTNRKSALNLLNITAYRLPHSDITSSINKKAQLSLTNPRDAKARQKLLQFDVLITLSLTILVYLHSFSCCCVRNLRNPEKFSENSNFKVIQGHRSWCQSKAHISNFLLVINSKLGRISYSFRDIDTFSYKIA